MGIIEGVALAVQDVVHTFQVHGPRQAVHQLDGMMRVRTLSQAISGVTHANATQKKPRSQRPIGQGRAAEQFRSEFAKRGIEVFEEYSRMRR